MGTRSSGDAYKNSVKFLEGGEIFENEGGTRSHDVVDKVQFTFAFVSIENDSFQRLFKTLERKLQFGAVGGFSKYSKTFNDRRKKITHPNSKLHFWSFVQRVNAMHFQKPKSWVSSLFPQQFPPRSKIPHL